MRKIAICLLCLFAIQISHAQIPEEPRVITTGVPFLLIAADARSAGMADQGVATSPDAFSMQYNPAKFAFSQDKQGFSLNYTPYLTELVNDISLGQVTYFNRYNERSAFAGSLRYFSLGEIELRQNFDDVCGDTFCEGDYSNIESLRLRCSVLQDSGRIGRCVWIFAASNEDIDRAFGRILVQTQDWECRLPIASDTGIDALMAALAGDSPLFAMLPGTQTTIYEGLGDCL